MKSTVAAATALVLALAATTASAGVVISQETVDQTGAHKTDQTLMIQGHKQKLITADFEKITDLDAGKMYVLEPKKKQVIEIRFPPVTMAEGFVAQLGPSPEFKKAGVTHKAAGYTCQNYAATSVAHSNLFETTECVASDAPGAKEFAEFQKAMADKLKGTRMASKSEIPDGIPVSSTTTRTPPMFKPRPGFSVEQTAQINAALAKGKATFEMTVTKIEVKELAAETFAVPAGYKKNEAPPAPHLGPMPGMPAMKPGAAPGSPAKPGTLVAPPMPAAPAAPAVPAPL